jgi:hypothetical protein
MIHVTERILDPAKTIAVEAFSIGCRTLAPPETARRVRPGCVTENGVVAHESDQDRT